MEIKFKKYLNIYGKIMEKFFFAIDQKFLSGKKGNYFWKKSIFYWLTYSYNQ